MPSIGYVEHHTVPAQLHPVDGGKYQRNTTEFTTKTICATYRQLFHYYIRIVTYLVRQATAIPDDHPCQLWRNLYLCRSLWFFVPVWQCIGWCFSYFVLVTQFYVIFLRTSTWRTLLAIEDKHRSHENVFSDFTNLLNALVELLNVLHTFDIIFMIIDWLQRRRQSVRCHVITRVI